MAMWNSVKKFKKYDSYLVGGEDFIMFLVIGQPNDPLQNKKPSKHALTTN
jgi:hypothetical protein